MRGHIFFWGGGGIENYSFIILSETLAAYRPSNKKSRQGNNPLNHTDKMEIKGKILFKQTKLLMVSHRILLVCLSDFDYLSVQTMAWSSFRCYKSHCQMAWLLHLVSEDIS